MIIPILFTLLFLFIYVVFGFFYSFTKKEVKELLLYVLQGGILVVWATWYLTDIGRYEKINMFLCIGCIVVSIYSAYFLFKISKKNPIDIVAKQENYWSVNAIDILKCFNYKTEIKNDRVEVLVNEEKKKIYRTYRKENDKKQHKYLSGNIFLEIRNLKLTKVNDVKEIKQNIYQKIFNKIKNENEEAELEDINYNDILEENFNIVEYFLMDVWNRYTTKINIGTATLNIKAENETERQLIGALDNITMQSVKRTGAGLYYLYMRDKNLLPKVNNESTETEDEYL